MAAKAIGMALEARSRVRKPVRQSGTGIFCVFRVYSSGTGARSQPEPS